MASVTAAGAQVPSARPKAPGLVVLALTTVLAVIVAVIGITTRVAPPPTVAQLAPQAVQQIKQAPDQQSSEFGDGNGVSGAGEGGAVTTTSTTSTTTSSGSGGTVRSADPVTRRCVGNPPRQIEDPQSPPCVPFWQGDNGGATWKGVTGDTIRIAMPFNYGEMAALQTFFNRRFEFYGRKLELFNPNVSNSTSPEAERNDAAKVDAQGAFASGGYSYNMYYAEELARRKIMSFTAEPYYTEAQLQEMAPYVWQYEMGLDQQWDGLGAWTCRRLAGRNAVHAGDVTYHGRPRRFGLVAFSWFPERPIDVTPLRRRLDGCGAELAHEATSAGTGTDGEQGLSPTAAQNIALQLRNHDVTSVLCLCNWLQYGVLLKAASNQSYFPEWIGGSYIMLDEDYTLHLVQQPDQLAHHFGITSQPREMRQEDQPSTWAMKEGTGQPDSPQTTGNQRVRRYAYHELLMIASGIQMAGPNLTPETFEEGLQRTTFPNPPDPTYQGAVGFEGDHGMTDDFAEFFWANEGISPYPDSAGTGALCYIDHGARRVPTTFPASEPPIDPLACDSRDV